MGSCERKYNMLLLQVVAACKHPGAPGAAWIAYPNCNACVAAGLSNCLEMADWGGIALFKCLDFCPPAAGSPGRYLPRPARRSLIAYSAIAYKP